MMYDNIQSSSICVRESHGVAYHRSYRISPDKSNPGRVECNVKDNKQWQSLTSFFMSAFLPHGYPESVSQDYLQYQIWDSIQAFASSITGSVCTHAVLKGVGVGDESASTLAATITWLIKDGTSMIGRIVFAWLKGTRLDCDCKKWRLFADVLNDIAMLLDLLSGYFPQNFTFIVSISGLFKSVVGVAGASTRAALTQHQARQNNMADVSAKDGSQETLVNLLALICSLAILPFVTKSFILTWILYLSMTAVHLIANYFAVKAVMMETFNDARFEIFTRHYLNEGIIQRNFLSVKEVNRMENVFFSIYPERLLIKLGCSFKDSIKNKSFQDIQDLLVLYRNCDYLLSVCEASNAVFIYIVLNRKASVKTQMESLYQAHFLKCLIRPDCCSKGALENSDLHFEKTSRNYTIKTFNDFLNAAQRKGFNTNNGIFDSQMWRADW